MNPRALIADDEPLMRDQLRARLAEVWPELEIVAEARNGIEAVEMTAAQRPELVFLDIRMPGMTGIAAAREIAMLEPAGGAPLPEIVFVTVLLLDVSRTQTRKLYDCPSFEEVLSV